jgi:hypothetical protein
MQTAQIRYASERGWGLIVAERSMETLKAALKTVVCDVSLRQRLSAAARSAAAAHDSDIVRAAFQEALRQAARHHVANLPGVHRGSR